MALEACKDVVMVAGTIGGGLTTAVAWLARASAKCQESRDKYIESQHKLVDDLLRKVGRSDGS